MRHTQDDSRIICVCRLRRDGKHKFCRELQTARVREHNVRAVFYVPSFRKNKGSARVFEPLCSVGRNKISMFLLPYFI